MPARADRLRHYLRGITSRVAPGLDDPALLSRFVATRDPAAFEALVARHGPMVLRVCRRLLGDAHDAEDAFQATFLVLARRAGSVRPAGGLAAWLHGVACRVALGARAAARRRHREGPAPDLDPPDPHPDPLSELTAREALRVLDEEVRRLPEAYRLPVVLCCLEGLSQEEAARQLGWSPGSVKGRLERGRQRLHQRLARRGLSLAAALALAEVARVTAAPPAGALVAATAKAATAFAAGAGGAPPQVAALAEGGLKAMTLAQAKFGALLLLAVGAVTAGWAAWARQVPAGEQPDRPAAAGATQATTAKEQARTDRYGDPLPPGAVARLGSLRLYHGDQVHHVTLSPDGKWVVSTASDGNRLWDAVTGRERPLRPELRQAAVFASRDKLLAVAKRNLDLQVWDVVVGKTVGAPLPAAQVGQLPVAVHFGWHDLPIPLALSPDGRTLVVCNLGPGGRPALRFCDVVRGQVEGPVPLKGDRPATTRLAFSADGKTLVLQCNETTVHVWDVAGRAEKLASPASPADFGGSIALSPDGTVLATAPQAGKRVRLWDTRTLKELPPLLKQPDKWVRPMTFSPDGKLLAVTYGDSTVRLWDLTTRQQQRQLRGKDYYVDHLAFSADGQTLAGADGYGATLWDMATGQFRHDFGHTYMVDSVHFSPDGRRLVSGASYTDNVVRVWEPLTGKETARLRGHTSGVEVTAYAPDGRLIASASQDGSVRLWDAATGREARRLEAKDGMVYAMAFAPDGKTVATGGRRKAVHLWDVATGRELRSFNNPGGFILRLAFSPDGKLLATRGVSEKEVRFWDVARGEETRRLAGPAAGVPCLEFSPDGRALAVGGDDGSVRLWDVLTGEARQTLAVPLRLGEVKRVFSVAFARDGRSLAVGYGEGDCLVRVWELASGQERARFAGHRNGVGSLAFSPDGTLLASGGTDRVITVWDVTGQRAAAPPRQAPFSAGELSALWGDLADADAHKAYRAMTALLAAGGQAVPLLKGRLRPAPALDGLGIDRLVADLDSDQFAVRQNASHELRGLGDGAGPALSKALAGKPSAEQRRRLQELLRELATVRSPERLRELRSVEVLEHLGTPDARQVLVSLAGGGDDARLTREAKASLERLARLRAAAP
jgi:RNA polymerase sigma factor (sigma-70 family)